MIELTHDVTPTAVIGPDLLAATGNGKGVKVSVWHIKELAKGAHTAEHGTLVIDPTPTPATVVMDAPAVVPDHGEILLLLLG